VHSLGAPGNQYVRLLRKKGPDDGSDVLGFLSRPEYNFREPLTQGTMMVYPRKPKILERQMFEALDALMRRNGAAPNLLQELQQVLAIHAVELCLTNDE